MDRELENFVWSRANHLCEYCRVPQIFDPVAFEIDHIIARQHHGQTLVDNLALICFTCNRHKGPNIAGYDLELQQTTALFHPRRDTWSDHFRWEGPELSGLSAIGRVPIHVLAINLEHRIALRKSLIDEGVFPPVPY
jgi:hypothetical protein